MAEIDPPWRLDPLQNIVNVQWGGAVEFKRGTLLAAENLSNEDSGKFTLSMWFRFPDNLAAFQNEFVTVVPILRMQKQLAPHFSLESVGIEFSIPPVTIDVGFAGPDVVGEPDFGSPTGIGTGGPCPSFLQSDWNHIFVSTSWDWTGDDVGDLWPFYAMLNGEVVGNYDAPGLLRGHPLSTPGAVTPVGGHGGISIKNYTLYIPVQPSLLAVDFADVRTTDFCDVQIWLDRYIDPTVNLNKFFKKDPNTQKGMRVSTKVAEDQFGKPAFLMKGGATSFVKNKGTAPEPLVVTGVEGIQGEIHNFSPAPPLAPPDP
jgi:hypothetical protein